uniref:Nucleolar protein 6 n=1 Tax=Sinocyclocheilus grahami TaxID=75366 RepID=A0A672MCZ3_SINGR
MKKKRKERAQNSQMISNEKRRALSDDGVLRPVKLSKKELDKAPTVEELNQLKEAEYLFHCSILKMQMEELLKEVALSEHRKKLVDSFVQQVTDFLQCVPESEVVELDDISWLSGVEVPFLLVPSTTKGKFHMEPPASISLVGSYPLGTCVKPKVSVDLAVTIPASILHPMDAINQRYPRKRALYLAGLARHLSFAKFVGSLHYSCLHGNRLRPVLLLKPPGKDSSKVTLRIHAIPPPDFLKPSRFHPQKNNIRTEWFTGVADTQQDSSEPPTPHYNSTVLGDHLPLSHLQFLSAISAQCPAFGEGVALLKVWLRQRELDQVRPQYFQDRAMTEAVLWSGNSISHRRFVLLKIIAHLLELFKQNILFVIFFHSSHADIPKSCIRFVGGPLDIVIKVGKEIHTTGEEESLKVVQSYNDLSKKLWQLKGLPLSITSVQGAHQALRYTQFLVFFDRKKNHLGLVPKENKPCPYYITPIKVIVHMKGSGKWPSEHMAIRHVKAAFHICLGELLCKQHKYKCHATPTYLDVWKSSESHPYHREPQILRESLTPEGMLIYRDNAEAQALELETLHKPFLTSTLHGLHQQYEHFGVVCRLAKHWLASQFLLEDIREEAAALDTAPLHSSPQVGFLRFLHLLSTFDWKNNPDTAEHTDIKNDFVASRESLPSMFIVTHNDKKVSVWTKEAPSVQMLQCAVMLAAESLHVLETQLDSGQKQDIRVAFRPPLEAYDDYDPVRLYLSELREAFGDLALFLYDPYCGTVIAVLWKPAAFEPKPFKTSLMNARRVEVNDGVATTVPNVEAILQDLHVIGEGLVKKFDLRTEKWVV